MDSLNGRISLNSIKREERISSQSTCARKTKLSAISSGWRDCSFSHIHTHAEEGGYHDNVWYRDKEEGVAVEG